MAVKRYDLKLQGQTSGGVAIATLDVEYWDDGTLRFTDATTSKKYILKPTQELHKLISKTLVGASGIVSTNTLLK
jgi:hypothetical protein